MLVDEAAVEAAGHVLRVVRRPAGAGTDDPDHAQALVQVTLMRFAVDPWDPDYGSSLGTALEDSDALVKVDIECDEDVWDPSAFDGDASLA